jgi:hypothetical protein
LDLDERNHSEASLDSPLFTSRPPETTLSNKTESDQLVIDELNYRLRQTQKLLDDAKGRIKAVELDSYETKRNAKLATEAAEALKAETEASLETAAEQLKLAHAVACGLFGMAELARAFMARKVAASRVTYRETKNLEAASALIEQVKKANWPDVKVLAEQLEKRILTIQSDAEHNRNKAHEYALAYGFSNFEEVFESLIKKGNE